MTMVMTVRNGMPFWCLECDVSEIEGMFLEVAELVEL